MLLQRGQKTRKPSVSEDEPLLNKGSSGSSVAVPLLVVGFVVSLMAAIGLAVALGVTYTQRQPKPQTRFAVIGDTSYGNGWNLTVNIPEEESERLVDELNAQDLDFVVYVGDLGGATLFDCTVSGLRSNLARLGRIRHPLIYTPGDNEWIDCYNLAASFPWNDFYFPPYALDQVREAIYRENTNDVTGQLHALGQNGHRLLLASQKDDPEFPEFIENTLWHHGSSTFCTYHIHGSECNSCAYGGNTTMSSVMLPERDRRFAAALKWITTCFVQAKQRRSTQVMLFSQTPLAPNYMTPKSFKLADSTGVSGAKQTQSLRTPVALRTAIIERIRNETLTFGDVYRVAPHAYAAWLAYFLQDGYTQEEVDTLVIGEVFTNWPNLAGGNPVHHFAGDVHVGTGEIANMPQVNEIDTSWADGGYSDLPVDNYRAHIVPGGPDSTGYLLCEVYPGTRTPVHTMMAPFVTIPYTSKPLAVGPFAARRTIAKTSQTRELSAEMREKVLAITYKHGRGKGSANVTNPITE